MTKEQIVEVFQSEMNCRNLWATPEYYDKCLSKAADRILAMSATQWVKVEDGLPEEDLACFWCRMPIEEMPWVGCVSSAAFVKNHYTHWMYVNESFFPTI